jgi:Arylsulfatase A and related enzymes
MNLRKALYTAFCALSSTLLLQQSAFGAEAIPPPVPEPFNGEIGLTPRDSTPSTGRDVIVSKDAPNILVILTDDVGFGASSVFGGPVETPTFEALANDGVRFNQFHTTALCSPTRSALLTGRNHHTAHTGMGFDYFYGFLAGETNQYAPVLWENNPPCRTGARQPRLPLQRRYA